MRSRKSPTPVAGEETIGRTQDTFGIAVQLALLLTGVEVCRLVGGALLGSARREAALGLLVGCFAFLSSQIRAPLTKHEKAFYCIHYERHLVPSDTKASYRLNPSSLVQATWLPWGRRKLTRLSITGDAR
jgi:hypothetical protein